MNTVQRQKGLSLVELMVALVLGLIVVGTVLEIFISSRQVYRVQDAKARLQENGRYAMHVLSKSIMDSGYLGCASRSGLEITNTLPSPWDFDTGLDDDAGTLRMLTVTEHTVSITNHDVGARKFTLGTSQPFDEGDRVIVSNCEDAAIFRVSKSTGNTIEYADGINLNYPFTTGWISEISIRSFESNGDITIDNQGNELVEGIENLQFMYGVGNNGVIDSPYKNAAAMTADDWSNLVSTRVTLTLASTEDNLSVDEDGDGLLRSTFSKTITLRNRVP